MGPTVRQDVFDAYWYFAAERQRVFDQRARRSDGPWTDDPILRQYKFCNTFRASDRVSQYLIAEVIYGAEATAYEPEDVFLRIVLFRLFSKESTWNALEEATGGVCRATLNVERLGALLDELRVRGPIYTAAFILCAHDAYGHRVKHRNHLELVQRMFAPGQLGRTLGQAGSLREVYEALREWPMMAPSWGTSSPSTSTTATSSTSTRTTSPPPARVPSEACTRSSPTSPAAPRSSSSWAWSNAKTTSSPVWPRAGTACSGDRCTPSTAKACSARSISLAASLPRAQEQSRANQAGVPRP